MKTISIEELKKDFDQVLSEVEQGHQFIIETESGDVLLMPHKIYDYNGDFKIVDDDLTKIHTNHNEGS